MTAEDRATPPASLSAAARSRIAAAAGVTVRDVGEALGKYEWTRAAMARMAQLKAEGKAMPTSFDDLEVRLERCAATRPVALTRPNVSLRHGTELAGRLLAAAGQRCGCRCSELVSAGAQARRRRGEAKAKAKAVVHQSQAVWLCASRYC